MDIRELRKPSNLEPLKLPRSDRVEQTLYALKSVLGRFWLISNFVDLTIEPGQDFCFLQASQEIFTVRPSIHTFGHSSINPSYSLHRACLYGDPSYESLNSVVVC